MKILLITGMPGAGKEEFLSVAATMKIPFLRMGDIVRDFYSGREMSAEGLSVGQFANAERETHGKNIWAKRALERMSGDIFLVDGCRSMDEVRAYKDLTSDVKIVAIHSPPDLRYPRLVKRAREDAPRNEDEFRSRDLRELSWGMGEVIAMSDFVLDNSGGLEDFRKTATKLLETIK